MVRNELDSGIGAVYGSDKECRLCKKMTMLHIKSKDKHKSWSYCTSCGYHPEEIMRLVKGVNPDGSPLFLNDWIDQQEKAQKTLDGKGLTEGTEAQANIKSKATKWTPEEESVVRENYEKIGYDIMHLLNGRSRESVRKKVIAMGLKTVVHIQKTEQEAKVEVATV